MELVWSYPNFTSLPEEINHQWPTTTTITTMAAAARNGPLPPHTRYNFECLCIGLIEDDPRAGKLLFSGNERVYGRQNAPMMRQWWQWILPCHQSILRVIDPLIAKEMCIRLLGGSFLSIQRVGAGWVAFCVLLGGGISSGGNHGDGGYCWSLAVGCSVLMPGQTQQ
jgi:hypothetical protein